ncbi:putative hemolysin [Gluconobacter morbifer]|uniref:Hemolysin n=1 Tax=Gluconobacter morbifer G707 TaxID=1088869 RepID=G6XKG8_9PROT|nr:DUF333 domain-containing protein [Gluconobacter morbifer]EHH67764.1 hypothetical protein GMO_19840 [Gluconobacter morbifer G707]
MRAVFLTAAAALLLSGCARTTPRNHQPHMIGMPNPASVFCRQQGGTDEIVNTSHGQYGICHLPEGQLCEEWTLYRDHRCALPKR